MLQVHDKFEVVISETALKQLRKIPEHIAEKLHKWAKQIKTSGLSEVRKIKSYHDEPLKGNRIGQRSIRLNKAYRAIYMIQNDNVKFIEVVEVNKHGY